MQNTEDKQPYILICSINREDAIRDLIKKEELSDKIKVVSHPYAEDEKAILIESKKLEEWMMPYGKIE